MIIEDWKDLPMDQIEAHFNPRLAVPDVDDRLDRWKAWSAEAAAQLDGQLDIRYGQGPKEVFDLYLAEPDAPLVVFIHGGYWRALDKVDHVFAVAGLRRSGLSVANLNYDLCPSLTLTALNEEIARALEFIAGNRGSLGIGEGARVIVMGHSAGAHAAALVASDKKFSGLVAGVIPISGIFDTRVLLHTTVNADLRLSQDEAASMNVLACPPLPRIGVLCPVGGLEPPAWIGQSAAYHKLAQQAGAVSKLEIVPDTDHFSVLEECCDARTATGQSVVDFVNRS